MGSSTRNTYKRSEKLIDSEIENEKISAKSAGISGILLALLFPEHGQSKPRNTLQRILYSKEYSIGIVKLYKIHKSYKNGHISDIDFGGIAGITKIELKEKICDYIGINDNEILKTSFNETFDDINILDPLTNFISFISNYTKNIMKNIFKQYTYEDTLNELESFDTEVYNEDIETYMDEEILPVINLEMEQVNFDELEKENDDNKTFNKISNAISRIMNRLKGKKE